MDLISSQQRELEEILSELEKKAEQQLPLNTSHHADLERTKMWVVRVEEGGRRGEWG